MAPSLSRDAVGWKPVAAVAVLAVLAVLPEYLSRYGVFLANTVLILSIFGVAFNLAFGFGELPAFGHAAFYGLGAYGVAITLQYTPESMAIPILAAIVMAFIYSVLVAAVSVQGGGIYFALLTFAFGQLLYELFFRLDITGGSNGLILSLPEGWGFLGETGTVYYLSVAVLALLVLFGWRLLNSPFGKAMLAVAHNENRARSIGYPVTRIKIVLFVLTATLASLGGILYVLNNRFVSADILFYSTSVDAIIVATIGGTASLFGPIVGAIFYIGMTELTADYANIGIMIVGAVFILVVLAFPNGIMGLLDRD
jgi:branched-chain amino acid transport system permease protein